MIDHETVLVLGAGASMDFGFPSGQQLLEMICEQLAVAVDGQKKMFSAMGHTEEHILAFREDLAESGSPSVDAFLEHRTEFIEVGKAAMALALLPLENSSQIPLRDVKNVHWYKYFFNQLHTTFERFADNKVSILTFNYDRSFEHYLYRVLQKRYGKSPKECAQKVGQIPIVHLYGQLGMLPWQEDGHNATDQTVPYGGNPSQRELFRRLVLSATSINIVHEDTAENKPFSKAHELLKNAERIYFLGFGYHPTNIRRLQIRSLVEDRAVLGTCYGLSTIERQKTRSLFHDTISKSIELKGCTCLKFFEEYGHLD